jgi:hypothetical protein
MLLNLYDARQTKAAARTLEKELAAHGLELAHGQALDVLAKLAGKHDWKQVAREREPATLDARLMPMALEHIRENAGNDYGEEAALLVHNGFQLRYSAQGETPDYVRVCDPAGREIAYWVSDEWRDDPELVMGAILGALAQDAPMAPVKDRLKSTARACDERTDKPHREPRIQDVCFDDLSAIVINGVHWSVYFVESEVIARLHEEPRAAQGTDDDEDDEGWEEDDAAVRLANDGDPPYITERDLTLELLRSLRWSAAHECFVDEQGATYDFVYAQRFVDAWRQKA